MLFFSGQKDWKAFWPLHLAVWVITCLSAAECHLAKCLSENEREVGKTGGQEDGGTTWSSGQFVRALAQVTDSHLSKCRSPLG